MNSTVKDSFGKIFTGKKKVLAVMPHPDDLEIYCGGIVARLVREGIEVRTVKVTSGDRGCKQENITREELKLIREAEDTQAMLRLGIKKENNVFLRLPDGEVD